MDADLDKFECLEKVADDLTKMGVFHLYDVDDVERLENYTKYQQKAILKNYPAGEVGTMHMEPGPAPPKTYPCLYCKLPLSADSKLDESDEEEEEEEESFEPSEPPNLISSPKPDATVTSALTNETLSSIRDEDDSTTDSMLGEESLNFGDDLTSWVRKEDFLNPSWIDDTQAPPRKAVTPGKLSSTTSESSQSDPDFLAEKEQLELFLKRARLDEEALQKKPSSEDSFASSVHPITDKNKNEMLKAEDMLYNRANYLLTKETRKEEVDLKKNESLKLAKKRLLASLMVIGRRPRKPISSQPTVPTIEEEPSDFSDDTVEPSSKLDADDTKEDGISRTSVSTKISAISRTSNVTTATPSRYSATSTRYSSTSRQRPSATSYRSGSGALSIYSNVSVAPAVSARSIKPETGEPSTHEASAGEEEESSFDYEAAMNEVLKDDQFLEYCCDLSHREERLRLKHEADMAKLSEEKLKATLKLEKERRERLEEGSTELETLSGESILEEEQEDAESKSARVGPIGPPISPRSVPEESKKEDPKKEPELSRREKMEARRRKRRCRMRRSMEGASGIIDGPCDDAEETESSTSEEEPEVVESDDDEEPIPTVMNEGAIPDAEAFLDWLYGASPTDITSDAGQFKWHPKAMRWMFIPNASSCMKPAVVGGLFNDHLDFNTIARFESWKSGDKDSPVTLQDIKDVAIFTAMYDIPTRFIRIFHSTTIDRFLRSLLVYMQYFNQVWTALLRRQDLRKRKAWHPNAEKVAVFWKCDLDLLRFIAARDYQALFKRPGLLRPGDPLFEMLFQFSLRVVQVGLFEKENPLFEDELTRLMRPPVKGSKDMLLQLDPRDRMVVQSPFYVHGSPVSGTLLRELLRPRRHLSFPVPDGFKLLELGVVPISKLMEPVHPKLKLIQYAYMLPEEDLPLTNVRVGILGFERSLFNPLLGAGGLRDKFDEYQIYLEQSDDVVSLEHNRVQDPNEVIPKRILNEPYDTSIPIRLSGQSLLDVRLERREFWSARGKLNARLED